MNFDLNQTVRNEQLVMFADEMKRISRQIGMKVSARGWCYLMEGENLITKDSFDRVEDLINRCRRGGILPVDFVAEEKAREFEGIENPTQMSPVAHLKDYVVDGLRNHAWYIPDWWEGEKFYIQMIVEKVDLLNLFEPICSAYHIPIANSKGWGSVLQRAEYARRFRVAEDMGLQPVLLYCGDHDPDGLRISEFLRKNLEQVKDVVWESSSRRGESMWDRGNHGYDPENLIINRFGLDYEFIQEHGLTWIDNLITGRKKNLASPKHPNFKMAYVQQYLKTIGERKCEANAILKKRKAAEALCRGAIEYYLNDPSPEHTDGDGVVVPALTRFARKQQAVKEEMDAVRERTGLKDAIIKVLADIEGVEPEEIDIDDYLYGYKDNYTDSDGDLNEEDY